MLRFLVLYGSLLIVSSVNAVEFKEVYSWKELDFNWPNADFKSKAIKNGAYIPENNNIHGFSIWKEKMFLTTPRYRPGVASSLNYITIGGKDKSPKLTPYPSWDANYIAEEKEDMLKDNNTILSAFRSWVDNCDRLWVIDSGVGNITGTRKVLAKPSIVIFDLKTDKLVRRHFLPESHLKKTSFIVNIVIDSDSKHCDNSYAYLPDLGSFALVVYSFKEDKSWRMKHHYFYFEPLAGQYSFEGVEFQWSDGIFGIGLSKMDTDGARKVFFHSLSSTKEFEVSNRVLQNETWSLSPQNFPDFKYVGDRGEDSQASVSSIDEKTNVLFYTQVKRDGIACWNTGTFLTPENTELIASDSKTLAFPNDIEIVNNVIWVLSNKLPKFIYSTLDSNEINYRIMNIPIADAIKGTKCAAN